MRRVHAKSPNPCQRQDIPMRYVSKLSVSRLQGISTITHRTGFDARNLCEIFETLSKQSALRFHLQVLYTQHFSTRLRFLDSESPHTSTSSPSRARPIIRHSRCLISVDISPHSLLQDGKMPQRHYVGWHLAAKEKVASQCCKKSSRKPCDCSKWLHTSKLHGLSLSVRLATSPRQMMCLLT